MKGRCWETSKLNKNPEEVKKYQKTLKEKLENTNNTTDNTVEEQWEKIEKTVKEAAIEAIGEKGTLRNIDWFDKECADIIQEKNDARGKMLQRETRANCEKYQELRRKANNLIKGKKKTWIKNQIEGIEQLNKENESRKFYKAVDRMKRGFQPRVNGCRGKDGKIEGEERKVMGRWSEYFKELLNETENTVFNNEDGIERLMDREEEENVNFNNNISASVTDPPTMNEMEDVLEKMKNNRAPGEDNITAELLKHGGESIKQLLYTLIVSIWKDEKMPENWNTGIIYPILKKGDRLECSNYRGITLLNVAYKILSSVINMKLKQVTETIIGEYQCGFRPNRGTIDQLFSIRQMVEKHYEHGLDLHMLFIDFKQAFDSVNRGKLYEAMRQMKIPKKLIRLIKMTMTNTAAKVKIDNKLSESFLFNRGVKQGDGLSTTLFILALHYVVKDLDQRGTIFNKMSQIYAYADDIVIVARTKRKIIKVYEELERKAEGIGLTVNIGKTKYMVISPSQIKRNPQALEIGQKVFEGVSQFRYLGNIIDNEGRMDTTIKDRIQAGNKAYFANLKLMKSKLLTRKSKILIYKTLVRPVITYGAETWTMTKTDQENLRKFERKIMRRIYGPVIDHAMWRIRSNHEINEIIMGEDIVRFIKSQRLQWWGHLERMQEYRIPQKMLKARLYSSRKRGRPRLRWIDCIIEDLKSMKVKGWREKIMNREAWRLIVREAKAHPGL